MREPSSEEFIISTVKQFFGLNRVDAQMLIDLASSNITNINRCWLEPDTDRVEHFLYIDSERGLRSDWIEEKETFDQAMKRTNNSSLFNLKLFLLKLESDQVYASLESNHQNDLNKWDSRLKAKYD